MRTARAGPVPAVTGTAGTSPAGTASAALAPARTAAAGPASGRAASVGPAPAGQAERAATGRHGRVPEPGAAQRTVRRRAGTSVAGSGPGHRRRAGRLEPG